MKKNDIFIATIDGSGAEGEGIAHFNDTTCFVPFSICGEKCEIKALKVKKNIAFCKLLNVLEKSSQRQTPACKVFGKCGGCQLQHLSYEEQLKFKRKRVSDCFRKIARTEVEVDSVVPSGKIYKYRNKLQLPLREEDGVRKIGFFRGNTHSVVDIEECPLHDDFCSAIIAIVRNWAETENVSFYNENNKTGLLKHLVVRSVGDDYLITLVAKDRRINGVNRLIEALSAKFQRFSLLLNVNEFDNNVVLSDKFVVLYGKDKIEVNENGIRYYIGAYSFMQVNEGQKQTLYNDVIACCSLDKETTVVDSYSGAGVLTAMLSAHAKKAYGVEIVAEAVESAKELAELNGITNMYPILGDCATELPKILQSDEIKNQKVVLVLDPPRKGVDSKILTSVLKTLPDRVVYISCNPQTLARDVGILTDKLVYVGEELKNNPAPSPKYVIDSIKPYDMFPQTKHVETLVVLSKKA